MPGRKKYTVYILIFFQDNRKQTNSEKKKCRTVEVREREQELMCKCNYRGASPVKIKPTDLSISIKFFILQIGICASCFIFTRAAGKTDIIFEACKHTLMHATSNKWHLHYFDCPHHRRETIQYI